MSKRQRFTTDTASQAQSSSKLKCSDITSSDQGSSLHDQHVTRVDILEEYCLGSVVRVGYRATCSCGWKRDVRAGDVWPSTGKPIGLDMAMAWANSAAFVHRRAR